MTEEVPVIDHVLVYVQEQDSVDPYAEQRMKFLREVEKIGLRLDHNITGDKWAAGVMSGATRSKDKYMIVKIYAPFQLLSKTAERMKLKMPLTEVGNLNSWLLKHLEWARVTAWKSELRNC